MSADDSSTSTASGLAAQLAEYRALRDALEREILRMASSIDGRAFSLQASLYGLDLRVGGYVTIETADGPLLGQVHALELATFAGAGTELAGGGHTAVALRHASGTGVVLDGPGNPFHDAPVRLAESAEVAAWLERSAPARARLPIGELALAPGVGFALDSGGFGRHTFMCGQSGSGKTYSLGVMLEQLLLETSLRVVVLDPNSDYVRLAEPRTGIDPAVAERYRAVVDGLAVHRTGAPGDARLRLRLADLERGAQAALLGLDPVVDREEHALLDELIDAGGPAAMEAVLASDRPEAQRLSMRARNLGVFRYALWARDDPGSTVTEAADGQGRGVVVDLGSLPTRAEQSLMANAVLDALWRRRERREPVLIVIDEAHNVCPAEPDDPVTALATEQAMRIAAEGRKFGLYLLVSTQRPQKVHPNVVTQCDNLVLMRLNSAADLAYTESVFSAVPAGLLARATGFGLGEALVAGKIASHAALLRFGTRLAAEGGADVPATWAQGRG